MIDGHLSEDQLSDLVDGMSDLTAQSHVETCPSCTRRLAAWRGAIGQVSTITPPPPNLVDRAVRASLEEFAHLSTPSVDQARSRRSESVIPLRRKARLVWAIAAGLLVVTGAAVSLDHLAAHSGSSRSSEAGSALTTVPRSSGLAGPGGSPSTTILAGLPSATASPPAAGATPRVEPTADGLGTFDSPGSVEAALAPEINSLASNGTTNQAPATPNTLAHGSVGGSGCLSTGPIDAVGRPPVFEAPLVYDGQSSKVFLFRVGGSNGSEWEAIVVRSSDCEVEVTIEF